MLTRILPRLSREDYQPRTMMEESGICWCYRVLCIIFWLKQTQPWVQETSWMDPSCLHIWKQDVSDVAVVVVDDSERSTLHDLQWLHSSSILQELQGGMLLDLHQARHSSNLPGPWGCQEFSQEVEIQSSRQKTKNFSTRLPYQMAGKISTHLGFQDGVLTRIHRRRRQAC